MVEPSRKQLDIDCLLTNPVLGYIESEVLRVCGNQSCGALERVGSDRQVTNVQYVLILIHTRRNQIFLERKIPNASLFYDPLSKCSQ
jgi:hypothetical protein